MLAEKVRDLGLDRIGKQGTSPIAQNFCELIVEDSWLNQLGDVIIEHGISLLRWRSGGVKHPHDMPPFPFPPSPTFGDSSQLTNYNDGWHTLRKSRAAYSRGCAVLGRFSGPIILTDGGFRCGIFWCGKLHVRPSNREESKRLVLLLIR